MGWLSGWTYRKSVTLSRATGAVTDYQMKLLVGESSGATGADVYCAGHCKTDFSDLRFTTSDGETLLDYWIESVSGTAPNQLATVWIKFDSIGTSDTTFYMYYGNASASAVSSIHDTMDEVEDFESGTVGLFDNILNEDYFSTSTTEKYEGSYSLRVNDTSSSKSCGRYSDSGTFWSGSTKRICYWYYADTHPEGSVYFVSGSTLKAIVQASVSEGKFRAWDGSAYNNICNFSTDTWYKVEVLLDASTYSVYVYDTSLSLLGSLTGISYGSITPVTYLDVTLYSGLSPTGIAYWDLIWSAKYVSPEPTWGTWGSEEAAQVDNPILINASTYIAAGAADPTTARLTPPGSKTTGDFQAGKISDDTNPLPSIDLAADKYTELEWSFVLDDALANGAEIELRVTAAGTALNNYEAIPKITIGTAPVGSALAAMLQMDHFNGGAL